MPEAVMQEAQEYTRKSQILAYLPDTKSKVGVSIQEVADYMEMHYQTTRLALLELVKEGYATRSAMKRGGKDLFQRVNELTYVPKVSLGNKTMAVDAAYKYSKNNDLTFPSAGSPTMILWAVARLYEISAMINTIDPEPWPERELDEQVRLLREDLYIAMRTLTDSVADIEFMLQHPMLWKREILAGLTRDAQTPLHALGEARTVKHELSEWSRMVANYEVPRETK